MIGRMYRPEKITLKNRKLRINTTFKSNMGGKKVLDFSISLAYDIATKSEVIELTIINKDMEIAVLDNKNKLISGQAAINIRNDENNYKVPPLRKILKPVRECNISEKNKGFIKIDGKALNIYLSIDSINPSFNELITIIMYPIVVNNREFIYIENTSKTPIVKYGEKVELINISDIKAYL